MLRTFTLLLVVLLASTYAVEAQKEDQIILNAGDTLRAKITRIDVGRIYYVDAFAGKSSLRKKKIAKIIFGDSSVLAIRPEIYQENISSWTSVKVYFDKWADVEGMKSSGTLISTAKNKTLSEEQLHAHALRKMREEAAMRKQSVIVIYQSNYDKATGELELVGECFGV